MRERGSERVSEWKEGGNREGRKEGGGIYPCRRG